MEELIKQAFQQVDVLGPHVQQGRYDLTGPNGEIILPTVWDRVVQPDWSITMTMWPMEAKPAGIPKMPGMMPNLPGRRHGGGIPIPPMGGMHPPGRRPGGLPPGVVPPPGWAPPGRHGPMPGNPDIIDVGPGPGPSRPSKHKSKRDPSFLGFFAGKPTKKK